MSKFGISLQFMAAVMQDLTIFSAREVSVARWKLPLS